jgi:hypothetical protein
MLGGLRPPWLVKGRIVSMYAAVMGALIGVAIVIWIAVALHWAGIL